MATQDDIDRIAGDVADQIRAAFKTGSLGARTSTADRSSERTTAEVKSLLLEWLGDKPYREDWVFQLVSASSLGIRHFSETLAERIIDEFAADTGNAVAPVLAQLEEEDSREDADQSRIIDADFGRSL